MYLEKGDVPEDVAGEEDRTGSYAVTFCKRKMLLNCSVGEDPESPLDCEEIQPVHPKGDQSWVFIGRTDVEAETPILWPPDAKS